MQADAGVTDSLTDYPAVVTVLIQEYVHVEELVRHPAEHLFLHNLRLQPVPAPA